MPSYARLFSTLNTTEAAVKGDHKPCSELHCTNLRALGEGYCQQHLTESRCGLMLRHKRTPSVLHRMLNSDHTSPARVHGGVVRPGRHGMNSVSAYKLMGINDTNTTVSQPAKHLPPTSPQHQAPTRSHDISPVRRVAKPVPAPHPSAQQAAKFLRHTSVAPASAAAAAALAVRAPNGSAAAGAGKPAPHASASRLPSLDDPAVLLSRHSSFGLAVERMPTQVPSVAALDFHDFHFHLPNSLDAFVSWRDRVSATPEGAAVALLAALILWSEGKELNAGGFAWKDGGAQRHALGAQERKNMERMAEDEAAVKGTLGRQVSSMRTSQAAAANAANLQAQLLRRAAGMPAVTEDDDGQKEVARRLTSLSRRPVGNAAPPSLVSKPGVARLQSFHRPSPSAKKLTFHTRARGPAASNGATSGLSAETQSQVGGWTMETRWCALIACMHPDQTVAAASAQNQLPNAAGAAGGTSVSFRGRSLCSVDVEALNDTWEVSPALARSFVLGTLPQHDFELSAAAKHSVPSLALPLNAAHAPHAEEGDDGIDWGDRVSALRLLSSTQGGPHALRLAPHPFAGGTADLFNEGSQAHASAVLMLHNGALRFPRSIKLRKDSTGKWRVSHFFNILSAPIRRFAQH
jgi:hypothetical protein